MMKCSELLNYNKIHLKFYVSQKADLCEELGATHYKVWTNRSINKKDREILYHI